MHSFCLPLFIFLQLFHARGLGAASLSAKSQAHSYATISSHAIEIHSSFSNASLGIRNPRVEQKEVTIDEAAAAAAVAASTVAKVATALGEADLPENVREAALEAASAAAARAALGNKASTEEDIGLTTTVAATWGQQADPGVVASDVDASRAEAKVLSQDAAEDTEISRRNAASPSTRNLAKEITRTIDADKLLYIGIFSNPQDFDRRDAARNGWLAMFRREFSNSTQVRAQFVIGRRPVKAVLGAKVGQLRAGSSLIALNRGDESRDESPKIELDNPWATTLKPLVSTTPPLVDPSEVHLDMQLGREFAEKGDMLHIPYEDLPIRVLMFFARAVETDYRYIMKVDVDWSFNFMPAIRELQSGNPDSLLYAGQKLSSANSPGALDDGTRDSSMKYFEGPCYLTSRGLAQRIAKTHLDHSLMLWSYNSDGSGVDDVDMGQWVAFEDQLLVKPQPVAGDSSSMMRSEIREGEDDASRKAKPPMSAPPSTRIEYRTMNLCQSAIESQSGD